MKKNYFFKVFLFALLLFVWHNGYSQLAVWDFTGDVLTASSNDTNVSASTATESGLTSTGDFFTCNGSAWSPSSWSTSSSVNTSDDYAEYTITANSGFDLTVTGFTFTGRRSSSGPQSFSIRSSDDSYASDLLTGSISTSCTSSLGGSFSSSITVTSGNSLSIRIYGFDASSTGNMRMDDVTITGSSASSSSDPFVTFDESSSSENETDATFSTNIPVTLSNYDADVTISVAVDGASTAEGGDYTLNTTSLVFDANETLNISLDINDDADTDDETVILNITVSIGTADLGTSQHTVTITDDEVPPSGLQVSSVNTNVVIDFDTTVSGINDGQFNGSGFSPTPSSGQLDSDAWKSTGMSDGDTAFGDTDTSGDYARGSSTGGVSSGGFYAFETSSGNYSLGFQPTGSDFTPGTITLRAQNQTGATVTDIYLFYTLYNINNENRTNTLNFEYSTDDVSYTSVGALDFTSPESKDVSASWESNRRSTSISSLSIADGGYFYLRWTSDNVGGANSQDEFAIDDITVNFNPVTTNWTGSSGTDWGTGGNWDNGVPTSTSTAIIPDVANAPIISGTTGAEVNNLTINETDGVTISSGGSLQVSGTSSGNITYNRSLGTSNWYLVGIPVAGETIEDMIANNSFDTGSSSNIGWAPYDNAQATAADRWDYQTAASTGSLTSGGGYSVKLASSGTLAFTGTMETADVGVAITSGAGNAFNLVGNPYPSYLAANTNADGTNNLLTINSADLTEQTMWLWDQGTGTYDQFNQASSAFYIAPGQGFFVESTGSNTFNFTEAMQSHQGTDSFQRTTNNRPEINLVITDGTDTRDADIFYIDGTTTGFDNGFDSSVFSGVGNSFAIYTHAVADGNGRNLGIQSLPDNNFENMVIPVGINATSGTQITISAGIFNLPAGIKVFLEDKNDDSFTELNSSSDFMTTLNADLNGIGRFYLHTKSQVLSVDEINADNISIYTSDANNLRIVGIQNETAQVSIYNILGKEVLRTSFEGNGLNDVALPSLRTGVYIVQLATETGTLNKKVIIE